MRSAACVLPGLSVTTTAHVAQNLNGDLGTYITTVGRWRLNRARESVADVPAFIFNAEQSQ